MRNLTRRNFVRSSLAGSLVLGLDGHRCLASSRSGGTNRKSCILLRMDGGPSQVDTFDPKPGTRNGGEFKAIESSIPGIQVSEHLPQMAEQMRHLTLIRSMVSAEGSHGRARGVLQAGFSGSGSYEDFDEEIALESGLDGDFAEDCVRAQRLVESGQPFVEVVLGGWDTHWDNFTRTRGLCRVLDPAFASLIQNLKLLGLWDTTLVIWTGEFGRKPRINRRDGRDHFTRGWSVVLGGCGIPEGQVIGQTSEDGMEVVDRPVTIPELFCTIRLALEIGGVGVRVPS